RAAGGMARIAFAVLFLIDSSTRTGGLEQVRWLSPFWVYDRSTPLVRGGAFDVTATTALAAAAIIVLAAAIAGFTGRDPGASLLRAAPASGRRVVWPSADPLLRVPVLATLEQQRGWIVGWAVGVGALAGFLVSLTKQIVDSMLAIPS